jgi:hypothetical protein
MEKRVQMVTNANDPLPGELDALARRLSARTREFNNRGEFSNAHDAFLERRQKLHAAIEAKLEAVIRRGAVWEPIIGRMAVVHLAVLKDADDGGRLDRVNLTLAVLLLGSRMDVINRLAEAEAREVAQRIARPCLGPQVE